MRVMSAAGEVSVTRGRSSWPGTGRVRPQIFLRRNSSREVSKFPEETGDLMTGYSLCHWEINSGLSSFEVFAIWHDFWDRSELCEDFLVDISCQRSPLAHVIQLQQEGDRAAHN